MVERPHILTIEDGVRNLDSIDLSSSEIGPFISAHDFVGAGRESLVLKHKTNPEKVTKIHLRNACTVFGKQFVLGLISAYLGGKSTEMQQGQLESSYDKVRIGFDDSDLDIREKIAATNSLFRARSQIISPINTLVHFDGLPFGYQTKFLNGRLPKSYRENPLFGIHLKIEGGEAVGDNTLIDISNSVFPAQIIDLGKFVPSDKLEEIIRSI